ncbi:dehydrogenase/reductase SDR family member 4 isoform X2 [Girardinichthys multiradiatus]|nr:dehydrogenase/reductase SDR family member 4 isoform X2 [Girardinichthys multiradiatus]
MFRGVSRFLRTNPVSGQRSMSQSSLDGKVAIVTASTDGIGLAAARALGKRGAHVVVSSRRQANVDKAVALLQSQSIRVTGTTCNVGKGEDREKLVQLIRPVERSAQEGFETHSSVWSFSWAPFFQTLMWTALVKSFQGASFCLMRGKKTVDQCGGIDILVSNAAVNPFFGNILDSTEDVWDKILSVNVKSAFLLTKLVVPHMEKRGGGNIIFVSSVAGYQPMQALGPYSVSKTALLGLTKALAPELAHGNIRVNCVAPGIIKTRFSSALWQNKDVADEFKKQLSIKRIGEPEEIGGTIAFLCSDEASYITGETIAVTGGMSCRL